MVKPFETFYRVKDAKGLLSTITIPVSQSTAIADLAEFASDMASLIQSCITGTVVSAGYSVISSVSDVAPNSLSDVQEVGRLVFNSIDGYRKDLNLPTFDETKMLAGSVLINVADTAIAALITAMLDGITENAHVVNPTTMHNEDLSVLDAAFEAWGKRRG